MGLLLEAAVSGVLRATVCENDSLINCGERGGQQRNEVFLHQIEFEVNSEGSRKVTQISAYVTY